MSAFSRDAGFLVVALGVLSGSNYVFHLVVSRQLGPSSYGALAALLAVLLVVSVPLGVLQTVVAQRTATLRARERTDEAAAFAARVSSRVLPVAFAAGALALLAAPALALFLDVGFVSASLLAPFIVLGTLEAIPLGVLQGAMRFRAFAALVVVGVAVRLVSGIGLVALGLGVPGAMLATSLTAAVTVAFGFWLIGLRPGRQAPAASLGLPSIRADLRFALLGLMSFWLLAQVDIALARHYLDPEEAGFYSSAGLIARVLVFATAAVAFVAFPRFVAAREHGEGAARWLRTSLVAGGGIVLIALAIIVPLRNVIVELTFGERYLPAADLVPVLCVAMAALALVGVLTYFHIAMGSSAYVISIAGLGAEIVLVALFHDSGRQIATVVAGVALTVLVAQYAAARSLARWRPPHEALAKQLERSPLLTAGATVDLSVVLPCHNVGSGLRRTIEELDRELQDVDHEVIVVSDGSTDETPAVAKEYAGDTVRVLHYPVRGGKGHALQVGLTEAHGRYVAFIDADGDISPGAIRPFLAITELYEPDIVLGSKRHPLSEVHYPPLRRLMSWTYHKLTRILFAINVRDTQTGLKVVRRDVLAAVLPRMYEKRYAFDLELLVVARSLGYKRVFEAPVRIDYRFASQIGVGSVARIALDTMAIFYRHYVLGSYRADGRSAASVAPVATVPVAARDERGAPPHRNGNLRILFLNWRDITNPAAGGAEVFTHEVAKRWVAEGHDVSLLTSGYDGCSPNGTYDGVRVRRIGRLRSGSFHLALQRELATLRGFDVVVDGINTLPSLAALWRRRLPPTVPVVYQLARDVWDSEFPRPLAAFGRWVEPKLLSPYREIPTVAISDSTSEDLGELGFRDVVVIPPGRDEPPPLDDVGKEDRPTLLFAGRLAVNKRPHHAVEAFRHVRRELPDAALWIAGQGPLERDLAADLPEGAELLGFVSRDELYDRMKRAHCIVVPSVREGWGLVVIEAGSVGTPAIAYDVPGLRDSVRDGVTGRLVAPGDAQALARAAVDLLSHEKTYATMCRCATEWAEKFTWNETAQRLLDVVADSVSDPNADERSPALWRRRAA